MAYLANQNQLSVCWNQQLDFHFKIAKVKYPGQKTHTPE